ncbi:MAG: hypothetical protein Fur0012_03080 [Elusimicrobiota bacterium]
MSEKKDFLIPALAGLIFSLPFYLMPVNNPDIFWHLSSGKFIVSNLTIPSKDFLSWTMKGAQWLDFEWLTQVIYYLLYISFSIKALYFLKIALVSGYLFITALLLREKKVASIHILWLLPLTAAAVLTSNDVRPENFSVLFFMISWYFLEKSSKDAYAGRWPFIFAVFFAIWVNFHGGFIYGLALIFLFCAGQLLNENLDFIAGRKAFSARLSSRLFLLLTASIAGTLANPYGLKIYSVLLEHFLHSSAYQDYLLEWRDFDITFEYARPFSFLLLAFPICYLINFLRKRKIDFIEIFTALFFTMAALMHIRNTVFAGLALTVLSSSFLREIKGPRISLIMPLLFLFAVYLHFFVTVVKDYHDFAISKFYFSSPGLVSFLKENEKQLSGLKMYNSWAWGGYLGWELYPSYRVFIDGRYIFSHMLPELVAARGSISKWGNMSKRYGIELVVMPPANERIMVRKKLSSGEDYAVNTPLYVLQLPPQKWALVYFDRKNIVAVKRDSVSSQWLKKNEYIFIGPNKLDGLEYPLYRGEIELEKIRAEIIRYTKKVPVEDENSQAGYMLYWLKKAEKDFVRRGK